MSVADIIELTGVRPTNQQLADMALQADREARQARAAGRFEDARRHQAEADKLADLLQ